MQTAYILAICLLGPLLILWLTYRFPLLRKIGPIIIAYIIGVGLGLLGLIPDQPQVHALQTNIASYSVPFAIPLLLLSADVRSWAKLAPSFIISTLLGLLGCALAITIGYLLCGRHKPELFSEIGGMLTGLYTGGNANMASIKLAIGADDTTYLITSAYSTLLSAIYLFIVIIVGKPLLLLLLPDFKGDKNQENNIAKIQNYDDQLFYGLFRRDNLLDLGLALLITLAIVGAGFGIASLFPKAVFQPVFILTITLLAIIASFNKKIRGLKRTFEAGTLIIIIFSIAVASQVSIGTLTNLDTKIFLFITIATIGTLLLHVLLSALFRIDTDTTLATSISLICSPPFVPVIG